MPELFPDDFRVSFGMFLPMPACWFSPTAGNPSKKFDGCMLETASNVDWHRQGRHLADVASSCPRGWEHRSLQCRFCRWDRHCIWIFFFPPEDCLNIGKPLIFLPSFVPQLPCWILWSGGFEPWASEFSRKPPEVQMAGLGRDLRVGLCKESPGLVFWPLWFLLFPSSLTEIWRIQESVQVCEVGTYSVLNAIVNDCVPGNEENFPTLHFLGLLFF